MGLRQRIAMLALVAGFAAAPGLALAASACAAACCPQPPCHAAPSDCDTSLARVPCCDEVAAAVPPAAKRSVVEAPGFQAIAPARPAPPGAAVGARPPVHAGDLACRVSALRLSVVLRI